MPLLVKIQNNCPFSHFYHRTPATVENKPPPLQLITVIVENDVAGFSKESDRQLSFVSTCNKCVRNPLLLATASDFNAKGRSSPKHLGILLHIFCEKFACSPQVRKQACLNQLETPHCP